MLACVIVNGYFCCNSIVLLVRAAERTKNCKAASSGSEGQKPGGACRESTSASKAEALVHFYTIITIVTDFTYALLPMFLV